MVPDSILHISSLDFNDFVGGTRTIIDIYGITIFTFIYDIKIIIVNIITALSEFYVFENLHGSIGYRFVILHISSLLHYSYT